MPPSSPPATPPRFGRYAVGPWLASGGTATVHLGRLLGEAGFSRVVALKRSLPQLVADPRFTAMLVDEARLAARVRHPNVVPVLDVVHTGDELGLVLEYVHGESLARLLQASNLRSERPPADVVATVLAGVLHGLHAAHEARDEEGRPLGIVHRDVSPQNVIVGADGVAHVLDFGIAKALGRTQTTREGHVKGKLGYMAPEQLRGETVDRRADVYSAAVVLWESLTGERLFASETEGATISQVLVGRVPAPSTRVPDLPAALDAITLRGLATSPDDRFASAREMALAVEDACPIAPSSVVGAWVESLAAEALAERAELVIRAERLVVAPSPSAGVSSGDSGGMTSSSEAPVTGARSQGSRRRILAATGAIASIVGVGVIWALVTHYPGQGRTEAFGTLASTRVATTSTSPAVPSAEAPPVAPPSASSPAASAGPPAGSPSSRHALPPPVSRTPPKKATKGCNPPYYIDAKGDKHFYPECLH